MVLAKREMIAADGFIPRSLVLNGDL
jgi:hypothetical protein